MTEVVMPQMGESIAEGTIVRWIKKVGDKVDRDEPLFEISTDKVDAEIPSPAAGVISEIRVKEGETVPINTIVALIGSAAPSSAPATPTASEARPVEPPKPAPQADGSATTRREPAEARASMSTEDALHQRSSPLVRKIAKEHNVDISQIDGTGIAGRVTKDDILGFIGQGGRAEQGGQAGQGGKAEPSAHVSAAKPSAGDRVEKMSVMRKRIAEHMIASRRTSAHVHSVFEVNFSRVEKIRQAKKAEFERSGAKLTYLSFILKAAVDALRTMPIVNASVDGDTLIFHNDINVGIPGVFGALFGMPIINQPQLAILGVGAVEKRAVVVDDAIAIRHMAYLTLGYDHRVIDGAVADEFMSLVKKAIENWDPNAV